MPTEATVRFLNIDLLLVGGFDRKPLLDAIGDKLFVMHDDAVLGSESCLVLELNAGDLDLSRTLHVLLRWVERLPPRARSSWAAASRRVFDIGIHAGLTPHVTAWTLPQEDIAALAAAGAEVMLTVYGARWTARAPVRREAPKRARTPRDRAGSKAPGS